MNTNSKSSAQICATFGEIHNLF